MPSLSPKQLEVLEFIRLFIERRGLPPTRGEIAEGLRLKNRQGIDQHLRALETKGAIELVPGISRGIRLTSADEHLRFLSNAHRRTHTATPSTLPLLGRIAAGSPILASENIEEEVHVDPAMFRPHADFLLRVRGDSMKDANILDRDLLAVHRISEAQNGQIVVARIGDEATVKYYRQEGNKVRLEPANTAYAPLEINSTSQEFMIEGLAVGVIRTGFGGLR
jgi:repressor LexA